MKTIARFCARRVVVEMAKLVTDMSIIDKEETHDEPPNTHKKLQGSKKVNNEPT